MSSAETLVGRELAGYQVEELIGRGGMGVCYRAHDPELDRSVALKVIAPELSEDSLFRERFLNEMRTIASVEHPHVCPVYRAGEAECGDLYLCLRYLEGEDMGKIVAREGALPPERAVALLEQVASALDHMHGRGITHRDVKPENVLLDSAGNAYLTDFGLAGALWEGHEQAFMAGTLAYLAPERIDGKAASPTSDLYALGCLAYAFFTGKPPFVKEIDAAILYAHMSEEPPSLAEHDLARLDPVLAQALAKDPAERPTTCAAFVASLTKALAETESEAAWPEGLPRPATRFLGRSKEIRELRDLLAGTKLLTMTGPGGTGKTRLALQAVAESAHQFPDGVWFVPLAPLREQQQFLSAVAQALGVNEQPGVTVEETLRAQLAGRRMLLILDNAEHLLPELADAVSSLRSIEGPTYLVTSRERLNLQAEHVYAVEALRDREAVALFNDRARYLNAEHDPADSAVLHLCKRLDLMPLAIELAAARSDVYSPDELLLLIGSRLDLLTGQRDHDPRHRTLASTIEWSYDLLNEDEQKLFRAVSVFPGGCTEEAALVVSGANRETLHSLVSKSLLRRRESVGGKRYSMLETIRQYAATTLDEEETRNFTRAAGEFLIPALNQIGDDAETAESDAWSQRMSDEQANVQALVRSARELGLDDLALDLASTGSFPLKVMGRLREAGDILRSSLEGSEGSKGLRARTLDGLSTIATQMGDQSTAIELGTQALALCEEIGDDDRRIRVLGNLGAASSEAGDFEASQAYLEAQIALARELGVDVEEARATYNLGLLLLRRGDIEGGAEQLERAKVKVDRLGHKMGVMYCLAAIGRARLDLGDLEQACANYVAAIELGIETGHDALSIDPVEELAIVAGEVGEREIGADLLATAAHFREIYGSQTSAIEQERVAAAREQLGLDSQQIDAAVLSLEGCLGHARSLSTRASEVSSRHARD